MAEFSEMVFLFLLFAGIGGVAGAFLRFVVIEAAHKYTRFPAGVLISNVIGTFILVFTTLYISKEAGFSEWKFFENAELITFFFNTGVIGSFTTFSAISYNNLVYLEQRKFFPLAMNLFLNLASGTGVVFAAFLLVFYIL